MALYTTRGGFASCSNRTDSVSDLHSSFSVPHTCFGSRQQLHRLNLKLQTHSSQQRCTVRISASTATLERATKMPALPFVKVADQEDMKLALQLNVIDPSIGGVLIMGERGTGKSVAVSSLSVRLSIQSLRSAS